MQAGVVRQTCLHLPTSFDEQIMRRLHREPDHVVELGEFAQPEERRGIRTRPVHLQPHYRHDGFDIVAAHRCRRRRRADLLAAEYPS